MKKVDIILFTMDRACQTDLALRSIRDKFRNAGKVVIFYRYTSDLMREGYEKIFNNLAKYNLDVVYKWQLPFEPEFKGMLSSLEAPYYTGFCDDDVFIKDTNCDEILDKLNEPNVSSVSLKIHEKETRHYPGYDAELPTFLETEPYLKWNWRTYCRHDSDFGYPTNVNAMIYPREYITNIINTATFRCPNSLEGSLNGRTHMFKELVCSFKESRVLNIVVNTVQNVCVINPNAPKNPLTPEELNTRFLDGEIISTDNLYGRVVTTTSTDEVKYLFKRGEE